MGKIHNVAQPPFYDPSRVKIRPFKPNPERPLLCLLINLYPIPDTYMKNIFPICSHRLLCSLLLFSLQSSLSSFVQIALIQKCFLFFSIFDHFPALSLNLTNMTILYIILGPYLPLGALRKFRADKYINSYLIFLAAFSCALPCLAILEIFRDDRCAIIPVLLLNLFPRVKGNLLTLVNQNLFPNCYS